MAKSKRKKSAISEKPVALKTKISRAAGDYEIEELQPSVQPSSNVEDAIKIKKICKTEQQSLVDSFVQELVSSISLPEDNSSAVTFLMTSSKVTALLTDALAKLPNNLLMLKELLASNMDYCSRKLQLLLAKRLMTSLRIILSQDLIFRKESQRDNKMNCISDESLLVQLMTSFASYICLVWNFPTIYKSIINSNANVEHINIDQEISSIFIVAILSKCYPTNERGDENNDTLIRAALITQALLNIATDVDGNKHKPHFTEILYNALFRFMSSNHICCESKLPSPKLVYSEQERTSKLHAWAETALRQCNANIRDYHYDISTNVGKGPVKSDIDHSREKSMKQQESLHLLREQNERRDSELEMNANELIAPLEPLLLEEDGSGKTKVIITAVTQSNRQSKTRSRIRSRSDLLTSLLLSEETSTITQNKESVPYKIAEAVNNTLPPRNRRLSAKYASNATDRKKNVTQFCGSSPSTPSKSKMSKKQSDSVAEPQIAVYTNTETASSVAKVSIAQSPMTRSRTRSDSAASSQV